MDYKHEFHTLPLDDSELVSYEPSERRVSIYTNYNLVRQIDTYDNKTAVCAEVETDLGNLIIYGTIMGVYGNREKSFQTDLINQMNDIKKLSAEGSMCVAGDFNLSFSDNYYFTRAGREKVETTFSDCQIEILSKELSECIDHIAVSESFIKDKVIRVFEFNKDKQLSDHKGTYIEIY